jgi:competence protein ComEC
MLATLAILAAPLGSCSKRDRSSPAPSPRREDALSARPAGSGAAASLPAAEVIASEPACGAGARLTIHFYDVGQALAALVELPDGRHLLVDAGDIPRRPLGCEVCPVEQPLLAKLRADLHGAPIDLMWITHQHGDHLGGAAGVFRSFPVAMYADNGRDARKAEVRRTHRAARAAGAAIRVVDPENRLVPLSSSAPGSGVTLTPVVPSAWPSACAHDPNECSIGLRIDYCASSVLFTGDAEHEEEAALDPGAVTLLQVGHHGSETSTTPGFLAKTHPRYAVISAGRPGEGTNRDYCHPRAGIVTRLTRVLGGAGARTLLAFDGERCDRAVPTDWIAVSTSDHLWATERDGDVVLTTTGDGTFARR